MHTSTLSLTLYVHPYDNIKCKSPWDLHYHKVKINQDTCCEGLVIWW